MPKTKSKRRSASSFFAPSGSGKCKNASVSSGGASVSGGGASAIVPSSVPIVQGVGGDEIDVVGGDDSSIYIGHGGAITKVEVGDVIGANPDCGGVIEDNVFVGGEGSVSGGGGEDMLGGGAGLSVDVGANQGAEGGEEPKGEKEKGNGSIDGGDGNSVVGSNVSVDGASGGAGEGGGANIGGGEDVGAVGGGVNISPIPLIPRRRLREILEHAQGECIMFSVFIMCV